MDALTQFTDLSVSEKLMVVEGLWDQIAQSSDPLPIPDWQKEELDRRAEAALTNPIAGVDWEEAKNRIRRRNG